MNECTKKIFVVDDEPIVRQVLCEFLIALGCEVVEFSNGDDALKAIGNVNCSAIFTDIRMPGTNGIELTRKINDLCPELPVIVMTGHGSDETCEEAMAAGAFHFLRKPFQLSEIISLKERIASP